MFNKITVLPIPYLVLLSIVFLLISFPVYIAKRDPKLVKQKLKIGAMIIFITSVLSFFSMSYASDYEGSTGYDPAPGYGLTSEDCKRLINMGLQYVKREKYDKALEQFRKAAEVEPVSIEAHNNIGAALLFDGKAKDALEEFLVCYVLNSMDAEVHINLAISYYFLKDHKKAKVEFEKAVVISKELAKDQVLKKLSEDEKVSPEIFLSKVIWKTVKE